MVPLTSYTSVGGIPIGELLDADDDREAGEADADGRGGDRVASEDGQRFLRAGRLRGQDGGGGDQGREAPLSRLRVPARGVRVSRHLSRGAGDHGTQRGGADRGAAPHRRGARGARRPPPSPCAKGLPSWKACRRARHGARIRGNHRRGRRRGALRRPGGQRRRAHGGPLEALPDAQPYRRRAGRHRGGARQRGGGQAGVARLRHGEGRGLPGGPGRRDPPRRGRGARRVRPGEQGSAFQPHRRRAGSTSAGSAGIRATSARLRSAGPATRPTERGT